MAKLKNSDAEKILKKAGGVFGDKGFIGTDYITTPIRKPQYRKLLQWEHEWNDQVSSFRAPVERAVATLMADPLHRLSPTAEDLEVVIPRRYRTLFLQGEFRISLSVICLFGGNVAGMERTQPADLDSAGRPHASMGACRSRTNADDRLPLASLGRVEGRDGVFEGRDVADVRPQSSVPHPLDDLTQLGAIGHEDEVDCQAVVGPGLGRSGDGY
jgi:hypothetical protein